MRQVLDLVRDKRDEHADDESAQWRASLDLTVDDLGPAYLHVGGVATVYDVLVNGEVVVSDTSMFARHTSEVTALLHEGANEVVVRCHDLAPTLDAAPRRPRARWRTWLVEESRLRWVRTTLLGRAEGFAPGPPVVGPWRPVVLETRCAVRVRDLILRPSVVGSTGVLEVDVEVSGVDRVTVEVAGARSEVVLDGGRGYVRIELPDVALWWPHTHGDPALHDVRVLVDGDPLDLPGDGTGHPTVRRVGFRALGNGSPSGRPDTAEESLALVCNGVPVFVRGAVWTPGDLDVLATAVGLGLNLVRVPGTAAYESDAFHARCDELGLLVWQDLMFATFDYPLADPRFAEVVEAEVRGEVERLLGHPSTVVLCGSAEHEQQAAMFGVSPATGQAGELATLLRSIVDAVGVDAVWVDSSPCGGSLPIRVDTGIAQYFGVGAYLRDLPDARTSGVRFASECLAFANLPDPLVAAVEGGVPRDRGADWDFADVREHYARSRYGAEPTLEQRQRVTGEVMAEVFGEWRRPASTCQGGIVLWLRDLHPGAGWGLLDHEGRAKPCAAALAPVLQPTAVWLVDEGLNGLDVHVAHDGPDPTAAHLRVDLLRADGTVVDTAEHAWVLSAHGHTRLGVEELLGRFVDATYAYRFGPPSHVRVRATLSGEFGTREAEIQVVTEPA